MSCDLRELFSGLRGGVAGVAGRRDSRVKRVWRRRADEGGMSLEGWWCGRGVGGRSGRRLGLVWVPRLTPYAGRGSRPKHGA